MIFEKGSNVCSGCFTHEVRFGKLGISIGNYKNLMIRLLLLVNSPITWSDLTSSGSSGGRDQSFCFGIVFWYVSCGKLAVMHVPLDFISHMHRAKDSNSIFRLFPFIGALDKLQRLKQDNNFSPQCESHVCLHDFTNFWNSQNDSRFINSKFSIRRSDGLCFPPELLVIYLNMRKLLY